MSKGLDAPRSLTSVAHQLVQDGFKWVARYYFEHSGFKDCLNRPEAEALSRAGLYIVSVWENGYPTQVNYFTAAQGHSDASLAFKCAIGARQPSSTPIYFAVDYDAKPEDVKDYFEAVSALLKQLVKYTAGAYGSGAVLTYLKNQGLISHEWLAQSHGWRGYEIGKAEANIIQGGETRWYGRDIDMDMTTGNGGGWK